MISDLWLWLVTIPLGLLVLAIVWSCRRGGSKTEESSRSVSSPTQQNENFIRCHGALQTLLSSVLPALQRTIDVWHTTTAQHISSCTGACPPYKKPSPKHSCQGCVDWANAIEAAVYPQSAKGSLQWKNAKPALFHKDPLEVMKLFVLVISDVNQTYSTLSDFDAASVLKIMAKFDPFHGGTKAVYDLVMKVSNIRNSLSHLKLDNNLHLNDLTFEAHWTNITDLVKLIAGLGKAYFTQQTVQGICSKLTKIKTQPIGPQIEEEALRPLVEDVVLKTMTDELKQGDPLDVSSCQKRLKAVYRTKKRAIGFLPGFPKEFSSDEFFVDLELVKQQKTPTKVQDIQLKTYTDLLHIQDERGQRLNHVLVYGTAGTGKTTLVSRLAYQWATAETESDSDDDPLATLASFQLVFVLDIRRFQPGMDLVDAIKDQLLRHVSKYQLQEYLAVNADKCLFLFDGYDELSSGEVVLNSEHLCSSQVIVTTRPNKVDVICDKYQGYVQVNVTGFSEESIIKFVCKFFGADNDSQARELLDYLEKSMFCQILVQYPLLLAMICVIFKDQNCIPDSISSLFSLVIEYLVRQWKVKDGFDSLSFEDFKSEVNLDNFMVQLGKSSLDGLMDKESKLIFREDDFESVDIVHKGYALGLLSNVSRVHGFEIVSDIFFIHKTFQEYCAAIYLSSLVESDHVLFKDTMNKMNLSDMEYVLRFCCGLSCEAARCILAHISETKSCSNDFFYTLMRNYCSSYDKEEPEEVLTHTKTQELAIILLYEAEARHGFNLHLHQVLKPLLTCFITDLDRMEVMKVLWYFTNNYPHAQNGWLKCVELVGLLFYHLFRSRHHQDLVIQLLSTMSNLSCAFSSDLQFDFIHRMRRHIPHLKAYHFKSISFDSDTNPKTVIEVLQWGYSLSEFSIWELDMDGCDISSVIAHLKMPLYQNLKFIDFQNTSLTEPDIELMCEEMIKSCKISKNAASTQLPLTNLYLSGNQVGSACSKLAEAMTFMSSLKCLGLDLAQIYEMHFQVLGPALSHLCNLERLDLSCNTIGNSMQAILQGINQGKMTHLNLDDTRLNDESRLALSQIKLPLLEVLNLKNSNVGSQGAIALAASLKHIPKLRRLTLDKNDIGSKGAKALAASLKHMSQLESLHLDENDTGSEGAKALAASLKHMPQLESLHLDENDIGSEGAKALAASLKHMPQLENLNLGGNDIGCEGAKALAASLKHLPQLLMLSLHRNDIGSEGATALAASFKHMPQLRDLILDRNDIGSKGAIAISSQINYIKHLSWLGLRHNNIGTHVAIVLAKAFPATDRESTLNIRLAGNVIGPDGEDALSGIPKLLLMDSPYNLDSSPDSDS